VSGSPGKPPAYGGTDFIIARDGKIAIVYSSLMSFRDGDAAAANVRFGCAP